MKKVIAMTLAMVMMLSTTAFAADDFYGIKPDAGITVEAKTGELGLDVAVTNPVEDAYYGVLLVQGTELPTVDTDILYINQVTADENGVSFDVLPITPEAGDVKLYVSSNATGATLLEAEMKYGTEAPVGPAVKFMNGAETVATLNAVDGAVVAPAAPTNIPTPSEGALIDRYEFVGWTDADATATYEAGASIPATAEMTLYAKYVMYNFDDVMVKYGDIDGNGRIQNADIDELSLYFDAKEDCGYADSINVYYDELVSIKHGDIDVSGRIQNADIDELSLYFDAREDCGYADLINTAIFFINID